MPRRMTFVIDDTEHEALVLMAQANDRTKSAEVREAVRRSLTEYVKSKRPAASQPGAEPHHRREERVGAG